MTDRLRTESEAATALGLSVHTLRRWRLTGGGPVFVKLGRAIRYGEADLEAYLLAARRRSTSDPGEAEVVALRADR